MSSGSGGTNWKTNVNRAKTKRWVEAKSYTYDGDDWGDADEYGEYEGYDEDPEPPPKPTGLRQAGKSTAAPANVPPQAAQQLPHPIHDNPQFGQPQPPFQGSDRERASSFGRGDDRQASFGAINPPFAQQPTDRSASPHFRGPQPSSVAPQRARAPSDAPSQRGQRQTRPSFEQARTISNQGYPNRAPWNDGSRSQSMTSSSAGDHQRREFSNPSAAPQPLQARPPRKSSLGQSDSGQPGFTPPIQTNVPPVGSTPSPQASVSTPTFVRPADIYRRMQEEKERERVSQESSRPSMDTLEKVRDHSPANTSDNERKPRKPALESVAERKSEYGMDGLLAANIANQSTAKPSGSKESPRLPEIPGLEGFGQTFGESFMSLPGDAKASDSQPMPQETSGERQMNLGPVNATTGNPAADTSTSKAQQPASTVEPSKASESAGQATTLSPDNALQREPSLGFRSAVSQAFDSQIPPTPTSTSDSNLDRSNSESTNDISPIISRNVSGAATRPTKEEIPSISSIAEEPATPPRPDSAATSRPSNSNRPDSKDSLQALKQGHRRNISTPSPSGSPARTPNVEVNRQLQSPQEAEMAMTTPVTATDPAKATGSKLGEEEQSSSRAGSPTKGRVRDLVDKLDSADNSRRGSQSSLGDKLEQPHRPKVDTNQSFRPQLPGGWASYTTNDPLQQPQRESQSATPEAKDPFTAAAAAGTALAGALATAAGFKPQESQEDAEEKEFQKSRRASAKNLAIHPEAQRLSLPRNDSDAPSSIVPTPMYMKPESSSLEKQEYFAPTTPPNQKSRPSATKELPQLEKTRTYEDMSTESSPNDLESDRLRKELVRELSPQAEHFDHKPRPVPDQTLPNRGRDHESVVLPSEYDSYWNAADGGESSRKASELGSLPTGSPTMPTQAHFKPINKTELLEPVEAQAQGQTFSAFGQAAPPPLPKDISHPQEASAVPYEGRVLQSMPARQRLSHRFSWEGPAEPNLPDTEDPQASSIAANHLRNEITSETPLPPLPLESRHEHTPSTHSVPDVNKELPQGPPDLSARPEIQQGTPQSGPPASTQPSEGSDQHEPLPQTQAQAKIPAFREIMAIKDINERLHTYDTTRTQFASMNTGLANWIQATINELPEHSDLLRNGGAFGPQARPRPTVSTAQTGTQRPSPAPAAKPSFSPGAGKMTSEKGKDLLRTAGVFGGKANSAAKGFFSKGRNKLRGMGGDKVD